VQGNFSGCPVGAANRENVQVPFQFGHSLGYRFEVRASGSYLFLPGLNSMGSHELLGFVPLRKRMGALKVFLPVVYKDSFIVFNELLELKRLYVGGFC
jgi:hypothetical protein